MKDGGRIGVKIGDLVLDLDLSRLTSGVRQGAAEMLAPFLGAEGAAAGPGLTAVPVAGRWRGRSERELERVLEASLRIPLAKFPFSPDPEAEAGFGLRQLRRFCACEAFEALVRAARDPREWTFLPLRRGCLVRHSRSARATLFLRRGFWAGASLAAIYGAIYFLSSAALPALGGLLLHGAGVRRQGRGLLFLGASGAGKSTVARYAGRGAVIADDGIAVSRRAGGYRLAATPFNQLTLFEGRGVEDGVAGADLSTVVFLKQDKRTFLERVPPREAGCLILKHHIHYFRYFFPEEVEAAFHLVAGLCRAVPSYRLHFTRSPDFWPLLEGESSGTFEHGGDFDVRRRQEEAPLRGAENL